MTKEQWFDRLAEDTFAEINQIKNRCVDHGYYDPSTEATNYRRDQLGRFLERKFMERTLAEVESARAHLAEDYRDHLT